MSKGGTLYEAWSVKKRAVQPLKPQAAQPTTGPALATAPTITPPSAKPAKRLAPKAAPPKAAPTPARELDQDLELEPLPQAAPAPAPAKKAPALSGSFQMKRSTAALFALLYGGIVIGAFAAGRHSVPAHPVLSPLSTEQLKQLPAQPSVLNVTPPAATAAPAAAPEAALNGASAQRLTASWDLLLHQDSAPATAVMDQAPPAPAPGQ
jgi:hypothetical protein